MHAAGHGDPSLSINVNPVNSTFETETRRKGERGKAINNVTTAYSHECTQRPRCKIRVTKRGNKKEKKKKV